MGNEIKPSSTPLKTYNLLCPKCGGDSVCLTAVRPVDPYCHDCEEEIDIAELETLIGGWLPYLQDRAAYLEKQVKEKGDA